MVLIFGWGSSEAQDRGEVAPMVCPRCHNQVFLHEFKANKQVSLFFVPMASYGTDAYLACPICRAGTQIAPAHRSAVDAMLVTTRQFRAGQLAPAAYQAQADGLLQSMGLVAPTASGTVPVAGSPVAVQPAAGQSGVAPDPSATIGDRLAGLGKLHADGVLTDEEFTAAKRRLLES